MSAARFLVPSGGLAGVGAGDLVTVDGEEARHAVAVRRLLVGERVDLTDGAGEIAQGTVEQVSGRGEPARLDVRVDVRAREERPQLRLILVQALAKGDRDLSAVETATELGVDAVIPWQADRCVVIWRSDRADRHRERWAATARAAAKQSRRAWVPHTHEVVSTTGLLPLLSSAALAVVLHEEGVTPLADVTLPESGDVLVVVGPEGGIGEPERTRLREAGAVEARLGRPVLRASTAGPAALAVLSARERWR